MDSFSSFPDWGFLNGNLPLTQFVENYNFYKNDTLVIFNKTGTEVCNQLFQVSLWCNLLVAVISSILSIFLILNVILIAKNFFFVKYVPHSAICTDEDIVVFS